MGHPKIVRLISAVVLLFLLLSVAILIVLSQTSVLQRIVDYKDQLTIPKDEQPQGIIFQFVSTIPGLQIDESSINYAQLQIYLKRLELSAINTMPFRGVAGGQSIVRPIAPKKNHCYLWKSPTVCYERSQRGA